MGPAVDSARYGSPVEAFPINRSVQSHRLAWAVPTNTANASKLLIVGSDDRE